MELSYKSAEVFEAREIKADLGQVTAIFSATTSPTLPSQFDTARLIETTMGKMDAHGRVTGEVIATATRDSALKISNPGAWRTFLAKTKEGK